MKTVITTKIILEKKKMIDYRTDNSMMNEYFKKIS